MSLEDQFHHAMIGVADFANAHKFGFKFRQMIQEHGAVEAARLWLARQAIIRLWELKSLSKSI